MSAQWRGQHITIRPPIPPDVVQPILWELFEINFRWEILALDAFCYRLKTPPVKYGDAGKGAAVEVVDEFGDLDASTRSEREALILGSIEHFNGSIVPDALVKSDVGFASPLWPERHLASLALYQIMAGWVKSYSFSADVKMLGEKLRDPAVTEQEVWDAEYYIAHHYICCFADVFNRAPNLPHHL